MSVINFVRPAVSPNVSLCLRVEQVDGLGPLHDSDVADCRLDATPALPLCIPYGPIRYFTLFSPSTAGVINK